VVSDAKLVGPLDKRGRQITGREGQRELKEIMFRWPEKIAAGYEDLSLPQSGLAQSDSPRVGAE